MILELLVFEEFDERGVRILSTVFLSSPPPATAAGGGFAGLIFTGKFPGLPSFCGCAGGSGGGIASWPENTKSSSIEELVNFISN